MHVFLRLAACVAGSAGIVAVAASAQTFPTKPIRIIVPFAPGGGNDLVGRLYAARMSEAFAQVVYVENRAGAGGNLGAELTAQAPATRSCLFPPPPQIDHPADCALTIVCRLAVVVNSNWHNPPKLITCEPAVTPRMP